MASQSQRNASAGHRKRAAAQGLVRVEVQAASADQGLIRAIARGLRGHEPEARVLRDRLKQALGTQGPLTAFDIFGSDLPDEVFEGVFDHERETGWRPIDL